MSSIERLTQALKCFLVFDGLYDKDDDLLAARNRVMMLRQEQIELLLIQKELGALYKASQHETITELLLTISDVGPEIHVLPLIGVCLTTNVGYIKLGDQ